MVDSSNLWPATGQIGVPACGIPIRDRSASYAAIIVTLCALALFCVIVRLYVRRSGKQNIPVGWDDAILVVCWITALPIAILSGLCSKIGIGKDIWAYPLDRLSEFYLLFYYAEGISYSIETGLVKIAVLAFYIRIFPSRNFQRITWALIWLTGIITFIFTGLSIVYCLPISYSWHLWDDGHAKGKCFNYQASTVAQATLNMTLEIVIVCLPMSTLYKLHIDWKKKLQVLVMFSVGLIVVIICVLRLHALLADYDPTNITWVAWTLGLWDAAEVFVSIICVCLPAAKIFFERLFRQCVPKNLEASRHSPGGGSGGGRHKHGGGGGGGAAACSVESAFRITKRTSMTISWVEDSGLEEAGAARLPDWATGWSRDDTQYSGSRGGGATTQITGGPFADRDRDRDHELGPWPAAAAKKATAWSVGR